MSASKIQWTTDTWNPVTGCDRVSAGCAFCYAMTLAKRLKAMGQAKYQNDGDPRTSGPGFGVTLHPETLSEPLRWRKPRRVFVNSMSDLFHDEVPERFIWSVFGVMDQADRHTFQVLTKRPQRMARVLTEFGEGRVGSEAPNATVLDPLPNVWLGTSVEDQRYANIRIPHLLATPAAVRFLSVEPMLGPIDLTGWLNPDAPPPPLDAPPRPPSIRLKDYPREIDGARIDWVIVGGESGHGARPMEREWAQDVVDQCHQYDVPVFVKQLGSVLGGRDHHDIDTFPAGLRVREFPAPLPSFGSKEGQ